MTVAGTVAGYHRFMTSPGAEIFLPSVGDLGRRLDEPVRQRLGEFAFAHGPHRAPAGRPLGERRSGGDRNEGDGDDQSAKGWVCSHGQLLPIFYTKSALLAISFQAGPGAPEAPARAFRGAGKAS